MAVNLDKLGAVASAACAVHCVLTGIAFSVLSVMGLGFLGSPITEACFLLVAILVGGLAAVQGVRKHHYWLPSMLLVAGISFWILSHLVFNGHANGPLTHAESPIGTIFSVLGGVSIVSFHLINQRLLHRCQCEACASKTVTAN